MPTNILLNSGRAVNRKIRNFTRFFCVCTVQNAEPRTHSSNSSPLRNGLRADWAVLGLQIALEVDDYPPLLSWQISAARRGQSSQTPARSAFPDTWGSGICRCTADVKRITIQRHIGHRDAAEMLTGTGAHPSGQATGDGRDRQDCRQPPVLRPAISERPGDQSGSSLRGQHRSSTRPKNATVSGIRLRGMRSLRL